MRVSVTGIAMRFRELANAIFNQIQYEHDHPELPQTSEHELDMQILLGLVKIQEQFLEERTQSRIEKIVRDDGYMTGTFPIPVTGRTLLNSKRNTPLLMGVTRLSVSTTPRNIIIPEQSQSQTQQLPLSVQQLRDQYSKQLEAYDRSMEPYQNQLVAYASAYKNYIKERQNGNNYAVAPMRPTQRPKFNRPVTPPEVRQLLNSEGLQSRSQLIENEGLQPPSQYDDDDDDQ
jgi:hypothetical protein